MRFDWVNILATVIFVSIVVTLILAVASYFAYKVREARRPKAGGEVREYRPSPAASAPAKADAAPVNAATKQ
jgi:heme/copper-type cytochrome/quinol oxidase subunit 2